MCMKKTILFTLFLCMAVTLASFANVLVVHEDDFEDRNIGDPTEGWLWYDNAVSHVGTYVDFEGSIVQEHAGTLREDINQRFGYKTDIEMTGNTSDDPCDYTLELDIRNLQGNWDPHVIEIWILTYNPDTGGGTYGYGLPVLDLYQADEWVHVTANLGDLVTLSRTWWEGTGWDMTNPTWSYEIGGPGWPGVEVVGEPWTQIFLVDNIKISMFVEPPEFARYPIPEDESIDVARDVVLSWTPGIYADKRNVYFGTSAEDVNAASVDNPLGVLVGQDQQETTYDPPGLLEYDQTYYWRVDELNDTDPNSPWRGKVWSFTTANFIIVDDFEDYNDYPPNEVWNTWIDGYGDPLNGSTAGYPDPDFNADEHYLDGEIVHSGNWSLPLFYDNAAGISEVSRSLAGTVTDWTTDDVVTLTLFYYGSASNAAEPMYVVVDGVVVMNDNANAARVTQWTRWDIPLQDLADMGVNLSNVSSLTVGFGNKANPTAGGSGMVFIDSIRLYHSID